MNKVIRLTPTVAILSILLMASPLFTGCATSPSKPQHIQGDNYAYTKSYMSKFIEEKMDEYDMVGMSVALVDGDATGNPIVWSKGFGYADKEKKIPATPNTIYRAGSVTKLFTGIAIMQLVDQGKINLDSPVQNYLPKLGIRGNFFAPTSSNDTQSITNNFSKQVTIRNMLTHHSGIPGDQFNSAYADDQADDSDLVTQTFDLASKPNTQFAYSNIAYALLGQVIEHVSGLSYEDYIKRHIFNPLGMQQSEMSGKFPSILPTDATTKYAKGYFNQKHYPAPKDREVGAGALNSTVLDLGKFANMTFQQGKPIISAKTLSTMQSPQFTSNSPFANNKIGLSWMLDDSFNQASNGQAGMLKGHGGAQIMFLSAFNTLPKHKLAVVVMTNSVSDEGEGTQEIAEKLLALALASKTGIKIHAPDFSNDNLPRIQKNAPTDLAQLPGTWVGEMGMTFDIRKKGKQDLQIRADDQWIDLVHRGNHSYHPKYSVLGMSLIGEMAHASLRHESVGEYDFISMTFPNSTQKMNVVRLPKTDLSPTWAKRLGTYNPVNAKGLFKPKNFKLKYKDGKYIFSGKLQNITGKYDESQYYIVPIDDHTAKVFGVGRNMGRILRFNDSPNGKVSFVYSGYELEK